MADFGRNRADSARIGGMLQRAGMRRWGRRNAGRYGAWAALLGLLGYRRMIQTAVTRLPHEGLVADIGCGNGEALRVLASMRPGLRVVALDLSPAFLARARRRHADAMLVCADAERLPLRAASFDAALSFGLLGHLLEPDRSIVEQAALLRPGGVCAIWTRTRGAFSRIVAWMFELENPGVAFVLHDPEAVRRRAERSGIRCDISHRVAGGIVVTGTRSAEGA